MRRYLLAFVVISACAELGATWVQMHSGATCVEGFYYDDFPDLVARRLIGWLTVFCVLGGLWLIASMWASRKQGSRKAQSRQGRNLKWHLLAFFAISLCAEVGTTLLQRTFGTAARGALYYDNVRQLVTWRLIYWPAILFGLGGAWFLISRHLPPDSGPKGGSGLKS